KTRTQVITGGKKTMLDHKFPKNIIVATPGRLLDKLSNARDAEMFAKIDYRIYDEADRLLDIGFEEELSKIDTILREVRQKYNPEAPEFKTVLFSATVDDNVSRFAKDQIGNDYKFINCVNENEPEAHENIHQTLVTCDNSTQVFESAISFILNNMEKPNFKAMVFLPTIAATEWFFTALSTTKRTDLYDSNLVGRQYRSQILRLHGKRTQVAREKTVKLFRHLDHGVLICTDVAARGLDLSGVSHVIQLNPSSELADYIHKVGRTARAGQKGEAITFLTKDELNYVKQLQKQRGVKFAVEMSGSDIPVVENILERVKVDDHIIDQMIGSYLSFQGQVTRVYRLNESKIIPSLMELYRKLLSSPEAKLTLSSKAAGMFRVNYDIKDEYFDYPQDRFSRRSGGDHQQKSDRYNKFNSDGGYQSKSRGYADRDGSSSYGHKSQSYGHSEGNSSYGHRESRGDSYNSGGYNKPRNNNYGNKSNYGGDRERSSRSNYNSGDRSSRSNYKSGDRKGSYSNDRRGNRQSQFDL
ncbi:P-loop containing nucleoside triphosphate hydrolase protein, partial [Scheffersomyces coipomensis]|uniref:P-loop containing nucleoside triphosphate hydrolase protein n=1 Tax=Scheffersomyces coipomensis TaxID=1788519 RepID=UPI00315CF081